MMRAGVVAMAVVLFAAVAVGVVGILWVLMDAARDLGVFDG